MWIEALDVQRDFLGGEGRGEECYKAKTVIYLPILSYTRIKCVERPLPHVPERIAPADNHIDSKRTPNKKGKLNKVICFLSLPECLCLIVAPPGSVQHSACRGASRSKMWARQAQQ